MPKPRLSLLVVALLALATRGFAAPSEDSRPNILFCLADDWSVPHASSLGDPVIRTPAFDRVAAEGVMYRNAHSAAPSCSPSRAAILTGQQIWRLGRGANLLGRLERDHVVYPDLLEQAGYRVGYSGKGYAPGKYPDWPHNPAGTLYPDFQNFLADRTGKEPFCFWLGSTNPHRPYHSAKETDTADLAAVTPPPYLPNTEVVRQDILDYYAAVEAFDNEVGAAIQALRAAGELENTIVIVTSDNGWPFPRSKATCYLSGTAVPLAVQWGKGIPGGREIYDFVNLIDIFPTILEAAGVTAPVEVDGRSLLPQLRDTRSGWIDPARDHVITAMETHVPSRDIGEDYLGGYPIRSIVTADYHYIENFKPERWPAGDPAPPGSDQRFALIARYTPSGFADTDASLTKAEIVTRRAEPTMTEYYSSAFELRPARELYDLRTDPAELHNLAGRPTKAAVVADLRERLLKELRERDDPRIGSGSEPFDRYNDFEVRWPPRPKLDE